MVVSNYGGVRGPLALKYAVCTNFVRTKYLPGVPAINNMSQEEFLELFFNLSDDDRKLIEDLLREIQQQP